jgi:hypothetical protein
MPRILLPVWRYPGVFCQPCLVQETDDDMFWDYGPPAKGSGSQNPNPSMSKVAAPDPAPDKKASASANGRTAANPPTPPPAAKPTREVSLPHDLAALRPRQLVVDRSSLHSTEADLLVQPLYTSLECPWNRFQGRGGGGEKPKLHQPYSGGRGWEGGVGLGGGA